eukprot:TRINITY_DN24518_c0_g1_i1.p2 TRINITY_DN24518_c0_g1~~TRINITY_DN24518_c0_g1_i1.p2  ORF type:complete len:138 (+),score=33.38 TRINITY_DN24518_c0_g1_i1:282-695(+)
MEEVLRGVEATSSNALARLKLGLKEATREHMAQLRAIQSADAVDNVLGLLQGYDRACAESDAALDGLRAALDTAFVAVGSSSTSSSATPATLGGSAGLRSGDAARRNLALAGLGLGCGAAASLAPRRRRAIDGISLG